jgi:hypothetical protein
MAIKSMMLRFDKFLHETEKAYLIRVGSTEHWLPKKLCRSLITNKKLGGNVQIPSFLYERITGEVVDEMNESEINDLATFIIEKHIPERKEPIKSEIDKTLLR